jgi:hemolysin activation/secretion protein
VVGGYKGLGAMALVSTLGCIFSGDADAQQPPTREQLDPQSQQPRTVPSLDTLIPGQAPAAPVVENLDDVVFRIDRIIFQGTDDIPAEDLAQLYADVRGQSISLAALRRIADETQTYFRRKGFTFTRVVVPEQRIENGLVTLRVIRGYISSVQVVGGSANSNAAVRRVLSQLETGRVWEEGYVERALLLARRIPGVALRFDVQRGVGDPGAIELIARVEDSAGQVLVSANNLGSSMIGPTGGFLQGRLNNLSSLGDQTEIGVFSTSDGEEQRIIQAGHRILLTREGLSLNTQLAFAQARPGAGAAPLDLESEALTARVELAYPIHIDRALQVDVAGGLEAVNQLSYALGSVKLVDERLRVGFVRLEARYDSLADHTRDVLSHDSKAPPPGFPFLMRTTLEMRKGVDALGASPAGSTRLTRSDADPEALVWRGETDLVVSTPSPLGARVRLRGQHTEDGLASYEEFGIGSYTIGRGYEPSVVAGDTGVAGAFELTWRLPDSSLGKSLEGFVFTDMARIWNPGAATLKRRDLTSYGAGIRGRVFDLFDAEIAYAKPAHQPVQGMTSQTDPKVLVNFAYRHAF